MSESQEFKAAKKSRTAQKAWLTRSTRSLNDFLTQDKSAVDADALLNAIAEFDRRLNKLDESQSEVELHYSDEKETELLADIDAAVPYRDRGSWCQN